jgi:hypothetical protein
MSDKVVYILKDRANEFIYHWLILMISGLSDISSESYPIYFHTFNHLDIHKETFELLLPKFVFINELDGYKKIYMEGPTLLNDYDIVEDKYYTFLRHQLLYANNLNLNTKPFRHVYISRNKSHQLVCNKGIIKRHINNELDVYNSLKLLGFEYITLETMSFRNKIQLFQESKIIVTPNGGALTFSLFAHTDTKVIELHDQRSLNENQYYNICKKCNINIIRYTNIKSVNKNNIETMPTSSGEYSFTIPDITHFHNFIKSEL